MWTWHATTRNFNNMIMVTSWLCGKLAATVGHLFANCITKLKVLGSTHFPVRYGHPSLTNPLHFRSTLLMQGFLPLQTLLQANTCGEGKDVGVKLHALANATKSPNWWKGLSNLHTLQQGAPVFFLRKGQAPPDQSRVTHEHSKAHSTLPIWGERETPSLVLSIRKRQGFEIGGKAAMLFHSQTPFLKRNEIIVVSNGICWDK